MTIRFSELPFTSYDIEFPGSDVLEKTVEDLELPLPTQSHAMDQSSEESDLSILFSETEIVESKEEVQSHSLLRLSQPSLNEQLIQKTSNCSCLLFGNHSDPYFAFLANDYPSSIEFGGRYYTCVTAAYEAQKFIDFPSLMDKFVGLNAQDALKLSIKRNSEKRGNWYLNRQQTMLHVLRAKFGQHRSLQNALLLTTDSYLCFHSSHLGIDPFWTDNADGSGLNQLGHALMQIRKEYGGTGVVSKPSNYSDFLSPGKVVKDLHWTDKLSQEMVDFDCLVLDEGSHSCFSVLSNSHPTFFEFGGLRYKCMTSAYEAQKFVHKPDLMNRFTCLNAEEAFALSAEKHFDKHGDWYETREEKMFHVFCANFGQNTDLQKVLLSTGGAYLSIHTSFKGMDPFWTDDADGSGQNRLGHLLMKARQRYGGLGEVSRPWNYEQFLPRLTDDKKMMPSLDKSQFDIMKEINDLNEQIDEQDYKLHSQIARQSINHPYTRFPSNNFPYDQTLVPLTSGRYINASFTFGKQFIGTQSPMKHTMEDFWSMIIEHDVSTVIMLNRIGDPGDDIYFPVTLNEQKNYGKINVKLHEAPSFTTNFSWRHSPHEEEPHAIFHRRLELHRKGAEPRFVHHFQYQNWRDFSPGNERATAYLVKAVDAIRVNTPEKPVVIHCHAGVGRTSVMITLLEQIRYFLQLEEIDIKKSVERQRSPIQGRCHSMMQSPEQYAFCYRVMRLLTDERV